jgi:hypothetical protein
MAQMIVTFLGTAAWLGGVLVFVVMAALPVLGPLVAVAALVRHPARGCPR